MKHGCGLIVTLDGIYYEGVFTQDVLTVRQRLYLYIKITCATCIKPINLYERETNVSL